MALHINTPKNFVPTPEFSGIGISCPLSSLTIKGIDETIIAPRKIQNESARSINKNTTAKRFIITVIKDTAISNEEKFSKISGWLLKTKIIDGIELSKKESRGM